MACGAEANARSSGGVVVAGGGGAASLRANARRHALRGHASTHRHIARALNLPCPPAAAQQEAAGCATRAWCWCPWWCYLRARVCQRRATPFDWASLQLLGALLARHAREAARLSAGCRCKVLCSPRTLLPLSGDQHCAVELRDASLSMKAYLFRFVWALAQAQANLRASSKLTRQGLNLPTLVCLAQPASPQPASPHRSHEDD